MEKEFVFEFEIFIIYETLPFQREAISFYQRHVMRFEEIHTATSKDTL